MKILSRVCISMEAEFADAIMSSINPRPNRRKRLPLKYQNSKDSLEDTYTEEKLSSEYKFIL